MHASRPALWHVTAPAHCFQGTRWAGTYLSNPVRSDNLVLEDVLALWQTQELGEAVSVKLELHAHNKHDVKVRIHMEHLQNARLRGGRKDVSASGHRETGASVQTRCQEMSGQCDVVQTTVSPYLTRGKLGDLLADILEVVVEEVLHTLCQHATHQLVTLATQCGWIRATHSTIVSAGLKIKKAAYPCVSRCWPCIFYIVRCAARVNEMNVNHQKYSNQGTCTWKGPRRAFEGSFT
jgi:hypothetical protein